MKKLKVTEYKMLSDGTEEVTHESIYDSFREMTLWENAKKEIFDANSTPEMKKYFYSCYRTTCEWVDV